MRGSPQLRRDDESMGRPGGLHRAARRPPRATAPHTIACESSSALGDTTDESSVTVGGHAEDSFDPANN